MTYDDRELLRKLGLNFIEIDNIDKRMRIEILKEAAERAVEFVDSFNWADGDFWTTADLRAAILGDHAGKMTDLDPAVQDAVQKNFMKLAGSNELLKQRGWTQKTTMLEPPDASFDCPESVDGQPGNGACQQCREEEER
jgi:hypothetical protein